MFKATGSGDVTAGIHAATRRAGFPSAVASDRFHVVLAPNAKLRPAIIPSSGRQAGDIPVPGFPSAPVNANTPSADHGDAPPTPVARIDLKLTPDQQVYCFEVNPSPAFSYYEAHTGQPIAQAIARYLAGEARVRAFGELMAPATTRTHSQRIAFCADRAVISIIGNGDGTF